MSPPGEPHTVVVLAAGRGRRAGGPKALVRVGGQPWWQIQHHRLLDAGCRPFWVISPEVRTGFAGDPGAPADLIESAPDSPMFESVRRGVEHTTRAGLPPHIFVLPVDVPAASRATWADLAAAAATGAAVPVFDGRRGHPVCLSAPWLERVLLPRLLIAARLDELIAGDRTEVPVTDPSVIMNLNTPDDFRRWAARSA